jgi:hypothetical protein
LEEEVASSSHTHTHTHAAGRSRAITTMYADVASRGGGGSAGGWTAVDSDGGVNGVLVYATNHPIVEEGVPPSQLPPLTWLQVTHESPSVRAGMSVEQEQRCRKQACALLKLVAEILRMPMPPAVTALTFMLRFYARHSYAVHSPQFVVPTCLYVASKLEEVPRRISDIVNVAHKVLQPNARRGVVRNAALRLDFNEVGLALFTMLFCKSQTH